MIASDCVVLSDSSASVVVPTALLPGSYIVHLKFSNPSTLSISTSSATLQICPVPEFAAESPFLPPAAYSGSTITASVQFFLSEFHNCSIAVCGVSAASCSVSSPFRVVFVVGVIQSSSNCGCSPTSTCVFRETAIDSDEFVVADSRHSWQ